MVKPWSEQVLDLIENYCTRIAYCGGNRVVVETQHSVDLAHAKAALIESRMPVLLRREHLPGGHDLLFIEHYTIH